MIEKHFILATAGHVDHGKSALVKALTGIDPDRLPEEKVRGITIELGFTHLELQSPNESELLSLGVIDVPGHEDFVRKMVSGAGAIDLALLVVAADDGWMPQTEEHLQILIYLGVPRLIVALTKVDLAESIEAVETEVRSQLRETPFADAAILRTAAPTGQGVRELREQLAREFTSLTPARDIGKPRLYVDRAFSLRGIGTVVTGTVSGGRFRRGDSVKVHPVETATRIRSLQNHNRDVEEIGPGARAAINLPDVPVAQDASTRGIRRGNIIATDMSTDASAAIDIRLLHSKRSGSNVSPLRNGARLRVHHGSANVAARVFLQKSDPTLAELRLTTPILAFVGDRVVLRDSSERRTLAGGIVLDPDARPKNFRQPAQQRFLETSGVVPLDVTRFVRAHVERDHIAVCSKLLAKSVFSGEEISRSLRSLEAENKIVVRGELAADAAWWRGLLNKAITAIDNEHNSYPEKPGLDLARLRGLLAMETQAFDVFLADLAAEGMTRRGDLIRRTTHRATLSQNSQSAAEQIRSALMAKPFDPPSRKDLARSTEARQALRFLIQTREAVEVSDEIVLMRDTFGKMRDRVTAFIRARGPATVAELRQDLGSSRRVVLPFLERLDRDRITRRVGDKRTLVP